MRNLFVVILSFFISTVAFSQNDVTTFLGIPVDGTKSDMIQKLKAKGFIYDAKLDMLKGEFNGRNSELHIVTNKNKVYRIMVTDIEGTDETGIKIRFNNLCKQFENNGKYIPQNLIGEYVITNEEDISYEMNVHNKRFEADYYQFSAKDIDSTTIDNWFETIQDHYSLEDIEKLEEGVVEGMSVEQINALKDLLSTFFQLFSHKSHKSVWFIISERYGKYFINIYYDNELNMAHGEDL